MTLTEFLAARLDEDERSADDIHDVRADRWTGTGPSDCVCEYRARVLREVEADRKILADYKRLIAERKAHPDDLALNGALLALHGVVGTRAAVYSDHPDYDPARR
jgi:Family of unknown function (DUF6221)